MATNHQRATATLLANDDELQNVTEQTLGLGQNLSPSSQVQTIWDQSTRQEIKEMYQETGTIVREQVKRLNDLQSSAFHLSNYYFVFQGVILAALSNGSTSLRCNDRWFLATISALAATLNLCALFVIGRKYIRIHSEHDESWREHSELYTRLYQNRIPRSNRERGKDYFMEVKHTFVLGFCMIVFMGFAVITLYGCFSIFCREDECNNLLDNDKCVKLCDGGKCVRLCTRC